MQIIAIKNNFRIYWSKLKYIFSLYNYINNKKYNEWNKRIIVKWTAFKIYQKSCKSLDCN